MTPPALNLVVKRCLEKDKQERWQTAYDLWHDLKWVAEGGSESGVSAMAATPGARPVWQRALPWPVAVVLSVVIGITAWNLKPSDPRPVSSFVYDLPEGQVFRSTGRPVVAFSHDGSQFVYNNTGGLYLRSMDELEARVIPGTEGPLTNPFFSPDGQWVGFYRDSQLHKIAISGGAPITLGDASNPYGASWGTDDTILFGQPEGIMRVSANGGTPELVVEAREGEQVHGPQLLPGGEWVLFTLTTATGPTRWDQAQIIVESLESRERKVVMLGGSDARYVPTGHLVYAFEGVLFAIAFDADSLETVGGAVSIVEGVRRASNRQANTAAAHYGFSDQGTLIYIPGPVSSVGANMSLGLSDRNGGIEFLGLPPGSYSNPRVSPDGSRIAYMRDNGDDVDVLIYALSGASAPSTITFGGKNRYPIWSADGERVAFQSDREGDLGIFWQRADGRGAVERLTTPEEGVAHIPDAFSPDGETLSFTAVGNGDSAVWMVCAPGSGSYCFCRRTVRTTRPVGLFTRWPVDCVSV